MIFTGIFAVKWWLGFAKTKDGNNHTEDLAWLYHVYRYGHFGIGEFIQNILFGTIKISLCTVTTWWPISEFVHCLSSFLFMWLFPSILYRLLIEHFLCTIFYLLSLISEWIMHCTDVALNIWVRKCSKVFSNSEIGHHVLTVQSELIMVPNRMFWINSPIPKWPYL
jgi:1,4-dihydroxy-2-naphthoate octaprenyltransferase